MFSPPDALLNCNFEVTMNSLWLVFPIIMYKTIEESASWILNLRSMRSLLIILFFSCKHVKSWERTPRAEEAGNRVSAVGCDEETSRWWFKQPRESNWIWSLAYKFSKCINMERCSIADFVPSEALEPSWYSFRVVNGPLLGIFM